MAQVPFPVATEAETLIQRLLELGYEWDQVAGMSLDELRELVAYWEAQQVSQVNGPVTQQEVETARRGPVTRVANGRVFQLFIYEDGSYDWKDVGPAPEAPEAPETLEQLRQRLGVKEEFDISGEARAEQAAARAGGRAAAIATAGRVHQAELDRAADQEAERVRTREFDLRLAEQRRRFTPSLDDLINQKIIAGEFQTPEQLNFINALADFRDRPTSQQALDAALAYARAPADVFTISNIARGNLFGEGGELPPLPGDVRRIGAPPDFLTAAYNRYLRSQDPFAAARGGFPHTAPLTADDLFSSSEDFERAMQGGVAPPSVGAGRQGTPSGVVLPGGIQGQALGAGLGVGTIGRLPQAGLGGGLVDPNERRRQEKHDLEMAGLRQKNDANAAKAAAAAQAVADKAAAARAAREAADRAAAERTKFQFTAPGLQTSQGVETGGAPFGVTPGGAGGPSGTPVDGRSSFPTGFQAPNIFGGNLFPGAGTSNTTTALTGVGGATGVGAPSSPTSIAPPFVPPSVYPVIETGGFDPVTYAPPPPMQLPPPLPAFTRENYAGQPGYDAATLDFFFPPPVSSPPVRELQPAFEPPPNYGVDFFAHGGVNLNRQPDVVGEFGPELVNLPIGTRITPVRGYPAGVQQLLAGRRLAPPQSLFRAAGLRLPSTQALRNLLPSELGVYRELGRLAGIPQEEFERELFSAAPGSGGRKLRFRPFRARF